MLESWRKKSSDPDFDPDDPTRNVVAFDPSDEVVWVVEPVTPPADAEEYFHERIQSLDDRLVSRTNTGVFYELDLATGETLDSWASDQYTIGGRRHEFEGRVRSVRYDDGVYLVVTGANVVGISDDGTTLWRRPIEREWRALSVGGPGALRSRKGGAGPNYDLAVDLESGEVVHTSGFGKPDSFGELETLE